MTNDDEKELLLALLNHEWPTLHLKMANLLVHYRVPNAIKAFSNDDFSNLKQLLVAIKVFLKQDF